MNFSDLLRILKNGWGILTACTIAGLLLGAGGYTMSRPSFESSARTSIMAGATEGRVDALYQVTQAIRVTMPQYLSLAKSERVANKALTSAGLASDRIKDTKATTTPDSTVIEWTASGQDPNEVQTYLAAALNEFAAAVREGSPRTGGEPVIVVSIDQPATPGQQSSLLSLPLSMAFGAILGFLAAFLVALLRDRAGRTAYDSEELEFSLRTVVVSQLPDEVAPRHRAWLYAATFVVDRAAPGTVLLLGLAGPPGQEDITTFGRALDQASSKRLYQVVGGQLGELDTVRAAGSATAVVLTVPKGEGGLEEIRPDVQSIRTVCRGPVCAVLDERTSHPRP